MSSKFYLPSSTPATPSPLSTPSAYPHPGPSPLSQPAYPFPPAYAPSLDHSSDDEDDLPYPLPLTRAAFLAPDFSPARYLASLGGRHQTLEDLRTELRGRVAELGRELVDLVNEEYEGLMGVGRGLRGGEEKVEGVRVGVLGFRREVEGVRDGVKARRREVEEVLRESEEDDGEGEEDERTGKVRRTARLYKQLMVLVGQVGQHPFIEAQRPRIKAVRDALILDLGAALRSARTEKDQAALLKLIASYRDIGEAAEAVKVLKAK
ncbi:hypothetical protein K461DRAFT_141609 [Myriangium duriaei CBS 260.36]|uniref:Conserved oligomeric Golgi complex subunit 2 n=1 Tax=Myriangium duriaei CBS 260.36 TaxID=1168546 RepID=A0A9P4MGF3_9PEZI|nr:hypothetical protein K461DRAFT_141609 [Myriangium duriaei CBS 260.36]